VGVRPSFRRTPSAFCFVCGSMRAWTTAVFMILLCHIRNTDARSFTESRNFNLHATIFDQSGKNWLLPEPNRSPFHRKALRHHKKRRRLPILHTLALLNAIHYLKTGEANVFTAIMAKHNYNDRKPFHRAGTISSIVFQFPDPPTNSNPEGPGISWRSVGRSRDRYHRPGY
jgi:hypothetical protein